MRCGFALAWLVCWLLVLPCLLAAEEVARAGVSFKTDVAPLIKTFCHKCHSGDEPMAELTLDGYRDSVPVLEEREKWEKVLLMVSEGDMPPEDELQPSAEQRKQIVDWLKSQLSTLDCRGGQNPGRVTIRRLNRTEYDNTIRDLVGVDFHASDDFPADDVGYGFDNIGDVLSLPPILMEKYLTAAENIVQQAFASHRTHDEIVFCRPGPERTARDCARQILSKFAARAYRRPVTVEEVDRLLSLVQLAAEQGEEFDGQIQWALTVVLVSPHFLFRVELDPVGAVRVLNDYELATRLSYFLWSSMPDEELFLLAAQEALQQQDVLQTQVMRMLRDPKSKALVENFAGQWLQLRNLSKLNPDPDRFPTFDEALRAAMRRETEMLFEAIVREDRRVTEFLDADFTFLNERLARHYGVSGVEGEDFRRVRYAGDRRRGVLTHASILTLTSNPTRTSPVKRGKWILENILGTPPPLPLPGVEELRDDDEAELLGSLRERMEQHRSKHICASCHNRMDPLGFGLENFDAVGAWRDRDGTFPIDASGTLPSGDTFAGPKELTTILKTSKKHLFCRCLSEKMLTYALGRGLKPHDRCAVDGMLKQLADSGDRFSSLIIATITSDPFRMRAAKGE